MFGSNFFQSSIFSDLEQMRSELENWSNGLAPRQSIRYSKQFFPRLSIGETGEDYRVYAFAPGLNSDSIDVSIQGNILSLTLERKQPFKDDEQSRCFRNERSWGKFTRAISLPDSVDPNKISATYKDGVLSVFVSKKAEVQPKKISVAVS